MTSVMLNTAFSACRRVYTKIYGRYLLVTNVVTSSGLLAVGDYVIQNLEHHTHPKVDCNGEIVKRVHDWHRSGRMAAVGLIMGPFNHVWYNIMIDRIITSNGLQAISKKILADQLFAAPFFCVSFFTVGGLLEGKTLRECGQEIRSKFFTVYKVDWCVWPPAQFINFYFLPARSRVTYVAFVTLCWNAFLSWIKHKDQVQQDSQAL